MSIDLTEDRKFIKPKSNFNSLVEKIEMFPWNSCELGDDNPLERKGSRPYGDVASDEMGMIIRRTSDNSFLCGDSAETRKPWFKNVLTEVLYEVGLGYPLGIVMFCERCGKFYPHITSPVAECPNCKLEKYANESFTKISKKISPKAVLPWENYHVMFENNEFVMLNQQRYE